MAATIWSTRLPRLLRSIASTGQPASPPLKTILVDAVSSIHRSVDRLLATVLFMLPIRLGDFAGCVSVPGIISLTIIVHHFANW
jgi:hypothetical protein